MSLDRMKVTKSLKWNWTCRRSSKYNSSTILRMSPRTIRYILFLSLFLFLHSTLILLSHLVYFQLVPVPRSPTVEDVLEQFGDYARTSGRNKCVIIHRPNLNNWYESNQSSGSRYSCTHNNPRPDNLLWQISWGHFAVSFRASAIRKRFVTGQKVVIGEEREPSAIYGAEHLLRMLGKMTDRFVSVSPQMVASSAMDGESAILVRDYVNKLLSWVERVLVRVWCSWICQVDGKS